MSQQHENPEEDSDLQDLEAKLARLSPAGPSAAFSRRTGRKLDDLERSRLENRIVWVRFAPVAAAACIVLTATFLLRNQLVEQQRVGAHANSNDFEIVPTRSHEPAPVLNDNVSRPTGSFLPVSQGNELRGIENGGIIGSNPDGLLERQLWLQFDNTQHYYDPVTDTHVRIRIPQQGYLRFPVPID